MAEPAPPAVLAEPTDDDKRTAVAIMLSIDPVRPDPAKVAVLIAAYRAAITEQMRKTMLAAERC